MQVSSGIEFVNIQNCIKLKDEMELIDFILSYIKENPFEMQHQQSFLMNWNKFVTYQFFICSSNIYTTLF